MLKKNLLKMNKRTLEMVVTRLSAENILDEDSDGGNVGNAEEGLEDDESEYELVHEEGSGEDEAEYQR